MSYFDTGGYSPPIIALHGYSRTADDYRPLVNFLDQGQRLIAFDLFYHGHSAHQQLDPHHPLSMKELAIFFDAFCTFMELQEIDLVGYSMGGRLVLALTSAMSTNIKRVTLIAPDGLFNSFWYTIACSSAMGRRLFSWFRDYPTVVFSVAKLGRKTGILNDKLYQLLQTNASSFDKRKMLYDTWVFLKNIKQTHAELTASFSSKEIDLQLIVGKKDALIPVKKVMRWPYTRQLGDRFRIVPYGHGLMRTEVFRILAEFHSLKSDPRDE